jgi:quercetin dioxygenase-like cupin family protein
MTARAQACKTCQIVAGQRGHATGGQIMGTTGMTGWTGLIAGLGLGIAGGVLGMTALGPRAPEPASPPALAREPGSHEKLRAVLTAAPQLEVLISDVVIPPGATVPAHYHPGEEFLYVIEGDAIHAEAGQPDRILREGDAYVIPPQAVHAPRGGQAGARAIVFRVHLAGQPERIAADMPTAPPPAQP